MDGITSLGVSSKKKKGAKQDMQDQDGDFWTSFKQSEGATGNGLQMPPKSSSGENIFQSNANPNAQCQGQGALSLSQSAPAKKGHLQLG